MFHYHPAARGHAPARAARVPSTGGACSACRACSCGVSLCWSGLRLCYRPLAAARASGSRPATGSASDRSSVVRCWPAPLAGPRQPPIARVLLVLASGRPPPRRPLLPRTGPPPLREDARQEDPRAIHLSWRSSPSLLLGSCVRARDLPAHDSAPAARRLSTALREPVFSVCGPSWASSPPLLPLTAPPGSPDPSLALRTPSQPCAARPAPRGDGLRPPRAPSPKISWCFTAPRISWCLTAPRRPSCIAPRGQQHRGGTAALYVHIIVFYILLLSALGALCCRSSRRRRECPRA